MRKNKNDKKGNPVGLAAISGFVSGTTRAIIDYILDNFLENALTLGSKRHQDL